MGNDPLEMRAIKEKLAHLEDFLPNAASPVTYEFGRFLADYIHSTLRPEEFVEEYRMAIADLMIGRIGFTGKEIRGNIASYPRVVYSMLPHELWKIAEAVLPKEFAQAMRDFMNESELLDV
jgi:hypothetical protein